MSYDTKQLKYELSRDEANSRKPYRCTAKKLTIGIGRNLDDKGLSAEEVDFLFQNDIRECEQYLDKNIAWWRDLTDARQRVLLNMCFNLGWGGLSQFKNTLRAVKEARYKDAAGGMLNSLWAKQVGDRAVRLAKLMEFGE